MKTYTKIMAIIALCFSCTHATQATNATLFLAHGSFGANGKWFRPGGSFYEALKKEAATRDETITPWLWSGGITDEDIITAAGQFVEKFLLLPAPQPISLLAHSNGGNVFAFATMLLAALYETYTITTETKSERGVRDLDSGRQDEICVPEFLRKPFLHTEVTKSRETVFVMNEKTEALLTAVFTALKHKADRNPPLHRSPTTYPIALVCCMGTPVNHNRFTVDMRVVKQALNLYSTGDVVQTLVGGRLFPEHERRANIQVRLHHSTVCPEVVDPCHKNVRHALIAQWLLRLPEILAPANDNAALYSLQSGIMTFYENADPVFSAIPYSDLVQSFSAPTHGPLSLSETDDAATDDDWEF